MKSFFEKKIEGEDIMLIKGEKIRFWRNGLLFDHSTAWTGGQSEYICHSKGALIAYAHSKTSIQSGQNLQCSLTIKTVNLRMIKGNFKQRARHLGSLRMAAPLISKRIFHGCNATFHSSSLKILFLHFNSVWTISHPEYIHNEWFPFLLMSSVIPEKIVSHNSSLEAALLKLQSAVTPCRIA